MKQLIINADDFGLHPQVNEGIIHGYRCGCITSTTLMPSARFFDDAVQHAAAAGGLGVGVHLTLVGERPVCSRSQVSSLVDADGNFPPQYPAFLLRFCRGQIQLTDIRAELAAQIAKVAASGLKITHLDSHQHLHILPGIIDIVIELAKQYGINAIRIPDESHFFRGGYPIKPFRMMARSGLTVLAQLARHKAAGKGLAMPDHFFGMLAGGNMSEQQLTAMVERLPSGVSEIMMHPGCDDVILRQSFDWGYHWQDELAAVTSTRIMELLELHQVRLISFGELHHG